LTTHGAARNLLQGLMRTSNDIPLSGSRPRLARVFWIACAILYVLLSCLDLFLTWLLVDGVGGTYESNPLAASILAPSRWAGLGCATALAVVGYSWWLTDLGAEAAAWGQQLEQARGRLRQYTEQHHAQHAYHERVEQLAKDIAGDRRTLEQAVADLAMFLDEI